jgi:hypothetical protein
MSNDEEQWIKIAEGGDGYNTYWHDEFAPVMQQIERYIYPIDNYQLDLNWEEICHSVPALCGTGWHISKDRPWEEFTECLECCWDCTLLDEEWEDGTSPRALCVMLLSRIFPATTTRWKVPHGTVSLQKKRRFVGVGPKLAGFC